MQNYLMQLNPELLNISRKFHSKQNQSWKFIVFSGFSAETRWLINFFW